MRCGGNVACIMNGANEVAVAEFLKGNISFLAMSDLIENTIEKCTIISSPSFDDYFESDAEARRIAYEIIKGRYGK
jgi:1-deoxy-D-xylulose-5-phosphate reductoisomerase